MGKAPITPVPVLATGPRTRPRTAGQGGCGARGGRVGGCRPAAVHLGRPTRWGNPVHVPCHADVLWLAAATADDGQLARLLGESCGCVTAPDLTPAAVTRRPAPRRLDRGAETRSAAGPGG
jgi:hypothetical protein